MHEVIHYRGVTLITGCRRTGQFWEGTTTVRYDNIRIEHVCIGVRDTEEQAMCDARADALRLGPMIASDRA
jgi:hypothetical protein